MQATEFLKFKFSNNDHILVINAGRNYKNGHLLLHHFEEFYQNVYLSKNNFNVIFKLFSFVFNHKFTPNYINIGEINGEINGKIKIAFSERSIVPMVKLIITIKHFKKS